MIFIAVILYNDYSSCLWNEQCMMCTLKVLTHLVCKLLLEHGSTPTVTLSRGLIHSGPLHRTLLFLLKKWPLAFEGFCIILLCMLLYVIMASLSDRWCDWLSSMYGMGIIIFYSLNLFLIFMSIWTKITLLRTHFMSIYGLSIYDIHSIYLSNVPYTLQIHVLKRVDTWKKTKIYLSII